MKQIQSVFNYINLYIKSFRFVCRSSGKLTAALLLLVPVQALLPTVTLYLTDRIISQIQSGDPDLLALLLAVWEPRLSQAIWHRRWSRLCRGS